MQRLADRLHYLAGRVGGHTTDAQRLLSTLIVGRLTFVPLEDRAGYRLIRTGTLWPLLQGVAPQTWRPQAFQVGTRSQPSCNRCSDYVIRWDSRRDKTVLGSESPQ